MLWDSDSGWPLIIFDRANALGASLYDPAEACLRLLKGLETVLLFSRKHSL